MAQYIDKDALVDRIKLQLSRLEGSEDSFDKGVCSAYNDILRHIYTLKVKEVDLEKEIKEVQREYKTIEEYEGYPATIYSNGIECIAKNFFKLGMSVNNKAQKGE